MNVYQIVSHIKQSDGTWTTSQFEAVVAAPSRAAAARALGLASATVAKYASITGNPVQIAVAMAQPGTVFIRSPHSDDPWKVLA